MTEEDIINRGKRVRRLLADEDVQSALIEIERDCWQEWSATSFDESGKREVIHAELRALLRIKAKLQSWVDELATRRID